MNYNEWKLIKGRIIHDLKEFKVGIFCFFLCVLIINAIFGTVCPMVIFTGFSCPGCGMTRAVGYFFTGHLLQSMQYHPFVPFWVLLGIYFVDQRYLCGRKVKGLLPLMATLCVAMLAWYLYAMLTDFPSQPVYVYREGNVLEEIFPFYRELLHLFFGIQFVH